MCTAYEEILTFSYINFLAFCALSNANITKAPGLNHMTNITVMFWQEKSLLQQFPNRGYVLVGKWYF